MTDGIACTADHVQAFRAFLIQ